MAMQRSPAVKVLLGELARAQLHEEEGQTLALSKGRKISRVNVIATLISKEESTSSEYALIDDSTGQIEVRNFDERRLFASIPLGQVIQLVARVSEFQRQPFLVPEIVKPLEPLWLRMRLQEIPDDQAAEAAAAATPTEHPGQGAPHEPSAPEEDPVLAYIRTHDHGEGVELSDILSSGILDSDARLEQLKMKGFVFEIRPGKYKVLE